MKRTSKLFKNALLLLSVIVLGTACKKSSHPTAKNLAMKALPPAWNTMLMTVFR